VVSVRRGPGGVTRRGKWHGSRGVIWHGGRPVTGWAYGTFGVAGEGSATGDRVSRCGCCDLNDGRPAWTLAGFFRERSLWPIPDKSPCKAAAATGASFGG